MTDETNNPDQPSIKRTLATALVKFLGAPVVELIRWGFGFGIIYHSSKAIIAAAGTWTRVDLNATAEGTLNYNENVACSCEAYQVPLLMAVILCVGCIIYARKQRRLARDVIERQHHRVEELEKSIDPGRSTSGLTERGETNPEDL